MQPCTSEIGIGGHRGNAKIFQSTSRSPRLFQAPGIGVLKPDENSHLFATEWAVATGRELLPLRPRNLRVNATVSKPATILPIVAPRRRGKSLMRRKWQQGRVFQKGRKKSDPWLPTESAYVQFWRDVPGQAELERDFVSLGICRTRTIAERKAAEKLEELGINSIQTFRESTSYITFKEQGEIWLQSLANRKRNPLEQTTSTTGDTPWTSGCIPSSVSGTWPTLPTLP